MKSKKDFIHKWSNWWCLHQKNEELNAAFEKELDDIIKQEIELCKSHPVKLYCDCDKWHDRMEASNNSCSTCGKPIN